VQGGRPPLRLPGLLDKRRGSGLRYRPMKPLASGRPRSYDDDQMTDSVTSQQVSNRDKILDAAELLLGRYGYRKMTVDDLAAEAGIGKGTIYLSFRSKQEAVLGTVDRIVDAVCDAMSRLGDSEAPAPERLRAMLLARILVRFDRVAGYRESLNDLLSAVREALFERRSRHFARETLIIASAIRAGQREGAIAAGSASRHARALVLATNNFLPYALSPRELGDRRRLHRDASDVIDLLVTALTTRDSPVSGRGDRS
jgi:AcrR family transcriptional regulator